METTRFLRKTAPGQYDVYLGGDSPIYIVGRVEHHEGRFAAFGPRDVYGYKADEDHEQFIDWADTREAAALLVVKADAAMNEERDAQARSEMLAELGSGWVHSGGNPEDAMSYARMVLDGEL